MSGVPASWTTRSVDELRAAVASDRAKARAAIGTLARAAAAPDADPHAVRPRLAMLRELLTPSPPRMHGPRVRATDVDVALTRHPWILAVAAAAEKSEDLEDARLDEDLRLGRLPPWAAAVVRTFQATGADPDRGEAESDREFALERFKKGFVDGFEKGFERGRELLAQPAPDLGPVAEAFRAGAAAIAGAVAARPPDQINVTAVPGESKLVVEKLEVEARLPARGDRTIVMRDLGGGEIEGRISEGCATVIVGH